MTINHKTCHWLSVALLTLLILSGCGRDKSSVSVSAPENSLTFGVLPVIQALPLFFAVSEGLFKQAGLNIELVTFNSTLAKEVALETGGIDGYFGDLVTPVLLAESGTALKVTSVLFSTTATQRMFAVLAPPGTPSITLQQVVEQGLAGSSNTVIEYLVTRLLGAEDTVIRLQEIKSIPIRLQLLLAGQVAGAVLPEPLATLAEHSGAQLIADDRGSSYSTTALSFRQEVLTQKTPVVRRFLAVVEQAGRLMQTDTATARQVMNEYCQVPELLGNTLPLPLFPELATPGEEQFNDVITWLNQKNLVASQITAKDLIAYEINP